MGREMKLHLVTGGDVSVKKLAEVEYDGGTIRPNRLGVFKMPDGQILLAETRGEGWAMTYVATRVSEFEYLLSQQAGRVDGLRRVLDLVKKVHPDLAKRGPGRPPKNRAA